jgi:hypothetical protein
MRQGCGVAGSWFEREKDQLQDASSKLQATKARLDVRDWRSEDQEKLVRY